MAGRVAVIILLNLEIMTVIIKNPPSDENQVFNLVNMPVWCVFTRDMSKRSSLNYGCVFPPWTAANFHKKQSQTHMSQTSGPHCCQSKSPASPLFTVPIQLFCSSSLSHVCQWINILYIISHQFAQIFPPKLLLFIFFFLLFWLELLINVPTVSSGSATFGSYAWAISTISPTAVFMCIWYRV